MYLTTLFDLVPSQTTWIQIRPDKPDPDPNCLALIGFFFEKVDFEKSADDKKACKTTK